MGAQSKKNGRGAESRTDRLHAALGSILGTLRAATVLAEAGWNAASDMPGHPRLSPLDWVDSALFDALVRQTTLEVADTLRREARGVMLSTPAQPTSLVPPPTSGVRVRPLARAAAPAVITPVGPARERSNPALSFGSARVTERETRRPPRKRSRATTPPSLRTSPGRPTAPPSKSGGVVLWTDDENLAAALAARFAEETLFRVADLVQLQSALFVFTGRSPLVVLDRRGRSPHELSELHPSDLEACSVVLWGAPRLSSPRPEGSLSQASRLVGCAAEASPFDVVDLCATLRRSSVRP